MKTRIIKRTRTASFHFEPKIPPVYLRVPKKLEKTPFIRSDEVRHPTSQNFPNIVEDMLTLISANSDDVPNFEEIPYEGPDADAEPECFGFPLEPRVSGLSGYSPKEHEEEEARS